MTEAAAMTARLAQANDECGDLGRRLDKALEDLGKSGEEEQRLRKVAHLRAARNFRLAARLLRVRQLRVQEVCVRMQQEACRSKPSTSLPIALSAEPPRGVTPNELRTRRQATDEAQGPGTSSSHSVNFATRASLYAKIDAKQQTQLQQKDEWLRDFIPADAAVASTSQQPSSE